MSKIKLHIDKKGRKKQMRTKVTHTHTRCMMRSIQVNQSPLPFVFFIGSMKVRAKFFFFCSSKWETQKRVGMLRLVVCINDSVEHDDDVFWMQSWRTGMKTRRSSHWRCTQTLFFFCLNFDFLSKRVRLFVLPFLFEHFEINSLSPPHGTECRFPKTDGGSDLV